MSRRILIIDAGGTSTSWALINTCDRNVMPVELSTPGFNPAVCDKSTIDVALYPGRELLALCNELFYYGAGCGSDRVRTLLKEIFSRYVTEECEMHFESDLLGACRALLGDTPGISCIIGTGSNSCFYDGKNIIKQVRPLGYILGDEGSGTAIGKLIIREALRGNIDDADFMRAFYSLAGGDYDYIIERVYRTPAANAYLAQFARLATEYMHNPVICKLLNEAIDSFFYRCLSAYSLTEENKVSFVGSLAYALQEILKSCCEKHGAELVEVQKSPIEGLIRYHSKN